MARKKTPHKYPIGIQTFSKLREEGYFYIDKTEYVYDLAHENSNYIFLSRPRRFGKSLLVSTFESYFQGRKELFAGLAIESLETEWKKHPVLRFDMSGAKHSSPDVLRDYLSVKLSEWEQIYGREIEERHPNDRLYGLVRRAYQQTGEKVVVLIDEYDAPLLDVVADEESFNELRRTMRNFYSPLKSLDPYLRFVFLTGITKFSQLSIFSELNNISNVSLLDDYSGICGITKEELLTQMSIDIDYLAEGKGYSREEAIKRLTQKYDGYHTSKNSEDIFNPYSLLNCFDRRELGSYWFGSGTPTFLIEMMRKFGTLPTTLGSKMEASESEFDAPTESLVSITPLLYQSGYITIKGYSEISEIYDLEIPNEEVRTGLMRSLIPNYLQTTQGSDLLINKMAYSFLNGDVEGAFQLMRDFFKTVPYCENIDYEGHWQQMLYVMFSLFGAKGDVEVRTSDGRIDMALVYYGKLYLIETKLDKSAKEALEQINLKEYDKRFSLLNLPIVKVGINFSTKERTITEWVVREN